MQGRHQYRWPRGIKRVMSSTASYSRAAIARVAAQLFGRLLQRQGCVPARLVTDTLRSYVATYRRSMPPVRPGTTHDANNCAETSHPVMRPGTAHASLHITGARVERC